MQEQQTAETYNGWTNYATWGVALVLDNEESTYNYVQKRAAEIKVLEAPNHRNVPEIWTVEQAARYELAAFLKDFVEELCGLESDIAPEPSLMAKQLIGAAMADVNFDEIAENILVDL